MDLKRARKAFGQNGNVRHSVRSTVTITLLSLGVGLWVPHWVLCAGKWLPPAMCLPGESVPKVCRDVPMTPKTNLKKKKKLKTDMPVSASQQKHAYKSCKPLSSWVNDLIQRVNFFNTWAKMAYTAIHHRYGGNPLCISSLILLRT